MTPTILGVDPGLSGGLAWVNGDTGLLMHLVHMPLTKDGKLDPQELATQIRNIAHTTFACVELVTSRPRQAGQFQFGINTGVVHGILAGLSIPYVLATPTKWKALYGIKRGEDETKSQVKTEARMVASKLFPNDAHRFARVKDDGVAEAALIALYGLSLYLQGKDPHP